jgi:metallo-beta-lactamase family protein
MKLRFCGAAGEVTGSCHHFTVGGAQFLVDCGLFQGGRGLYERNRARWPFVARELDFVLLSHAHLDHSGLLPRLVREGFRGPIHCTRATADLLEVMLADSAHLQQAEAERAARRGREFTVLYTPREADLTLERLHPVAYDEDFIAAPGVHVRLRDAGHILGSAIIEMQLEEAGRRVKVVASGDLGQPGRPILRDPALVESADVLLLESTYGDRNHRSLEATLDELVVALRRALLEKHGNVIVPAFAVGRTQELLYCLNDLVVAGRVPPLQVFLDSPMAQEVTRITARHFALFDDAARAMANHHPPPARRLKVTFTETVQESMAINRIGAGAVIIAASGMCDGGRIRHHLRHHLPNPRTTVLITGFQAAGTLGRQLVDGAREVRIFGEMVPVNAEVVTLGGFSAHADQSALVGWVTAMRHAPQRIFLVHGEERGTEGLAAALGKRGFEPRIARAGEVVEL